jgi:hypothetical protein
MINAEIPVKDQCIIIGNAVEGKYGIYFDCPSRFTTNTSTFILHSNINRLQFPIRVSIKESVKTTNMRLNQEKPPFSYYQQLVKRFSVKNHEINGRIKKSTAYNDLMHIYSIENL